MNKSQLVDSIVASVGLTKADAGKTVDAVFAQIANALKAGDQVAVIGFGTFLVRERGARTGRNPRTGETIQIPASRAPAFKAGKALKDALNSGM